VVRDGTVTGWVARGSAVDSWHFVGVQIINRSVLAAVPLGAAAETVSGIYRDRWQSDRSGVAAYRVAPAHDVGTPRDYLDSAIRLSPSTVVPKPNIDPVAHLTHTFVWPTATIEAGVVLDQCIVAGNVVVPRGFAASDAVIVPASLVRNDEHHLIRDGMAVFPLTR
jgi:hypothetical protein